MMQPSTEQFRRSSSITLWWWMTFGMIVNFRYVGGNNPGPGYTTALRYCVKGADCHQAVGEVCWWYFDGCPRGQCMCDPRYAFSDDSGHCRAKKLGEEPCNSADRCPKGMLCIDGKCQCHVGKMTSDRTYCIREQERVLGQNCHPVHHTCLQRSPRGYTTAEVKCAPYGRCRCTEGYKRDGGLCRRWHIGESGCSKDHECQGGALCVDRMCACPNGYVPVAGNSKCARLGATVELGLGKSCDEISERLYCANRLVCHQCAGQTNYVCVHFADSVDGRFVSSSRRLKSTTRLSVICTLCSILISTLSITHGHSLR